MGETLPPLTVVDADGNPRVIPTYVLEFSGATITRIGPTSVRVMVDSGGAGGSTVVYAPTGGEYLTYQANATLTAERVVAASDNITIVSSGTSFLISAITNAGGSSVIYAPTGGSYLAYQADVNLTAERVIAASDNITIVSSGTSFLISATTNAGGGGTQVISIPMALLTVEVNSGNAFWTAATDLTNMDRAYVNHVDSGRSVSTWWCQMPRNLNATPAWGVDIINQAVAGGSAGGFIVLNVDGMSAAVGESANTLAASTVQLVAAGSFRLNTADILSICTLATTNFDGTLATSATDYVKIKITRQGNADTLNSDWWIYAVNANCTVNT